MKINDFLCTWWTKAMTEPKINSRLVFLGTFIVTSALMVYHTIVYLHFKTHDPAYPTIMTVLGGTHAGNGLARYLTKTTDKDSH